MRRIVALPVLVILAACHSAPPPASVPPAQAKEDSAAPAEPNEVTPEVIHARVAGILATFPNRVIPAGDIFVTWSPKLDLITTVSRTDSTVASSLVSTYGIIGTAVADDGMEDQLLPLIQAASTDTQRLRLSIYRPYQSRWDTIAVACTKMQGATFATETAPDGEHFFWSITADGALVRLTRDQNPGFERRPLETTRREADYLRLRQLWEH